MAERPGRGLCQISARQTEIRNDSGGQEEYSEVKYASTLDISWWYGHFAIPPGAAEFAVLVGSTGEEYLQTTAFTGARRTPFVASAIVESTILEALSRIPIASISLERDYDIMIDNIRLLADEWNFLVQWTQALLEVAEE
jgi:hypothetical protein